MKPRKYSFVHKIVFTTYLVLTLIFLVILTINASSNLTGNRTLLATGIFLYLIFMSFGLYFKKSIFLVISIVNFLVGTSLVAWLGLMAYPLQNNFITTVIILGFIGLFLSISGYIVNSNE